MKPTQIRALEDQVEPDLARRFRVAQHSLAALRPSGRASSYYSFEIHRALDAGMFLSVMILCSALLEIWLRDLLVIRKATQSSPKSKLEFEWRISQVDKEIEEDRRIGFDAILSELVELDVIDELERQRLKRVYSKFRNPLMHGISGRFVGRREVLKASQGSPPEREQMFLEMISNGVRGRSTKIEDTLDHVACEYLEAVVNFIAAHPLPNRI